GSSDVCSSDLEQREVIHLHAFGVLRAQAAVEERPLVVVHRRGLARPAEKVARQFHHVVAAAAFFGVWAKLIGKFAGVGLPAFAVAGAAGAIGALRNDFVPEIIGDVAVAPVAGQF